jgi:hypothetical protein
MFRILQAVALFFVMFFSMKYLGFDKQTAILVSLIPLVLGFINVLTGPAFGLAGITFIVAALSSLLPLQYHSGLDFAEQMINSTTFDRHSDSTKSAKEKALVK